MIIIFDIKIEIGIFEHQMRQISKKFRTFSILGLIWALTGSKYFINFFVI